MDRHVIKHGLVNAALTTAYILLVVAMIFNAEAWFGAYEGEDTMLIPVVMLMLFVVSAAITGSLVFGRPVMWYADGKKKAAVQLLGTTLGFLVIFGLVFVSIIL